MPPLCREIACIVVIDTFGRFVLQQRDDVPNIICPGRLALFGGHREADESFLECAEREFREELTYVVQSNRFEHLLSYEGPDLDVGSGLARGEFFVVRNVPVNSLIVCEGALLVATREEIGMLQSKFAPLAWLALARFFSENRLQNQYSSSYSST